MKFEANGIHVPRGPVNSSKLFSMSNATTKKSTAMTKAMNITAV